LRHDLEGVIEGSELFDWQGWFLRVGERLRDRSGNALTHIFDNYNNKRLIAYMSAYYCIDDSNSDKKIEKVKKL
jgi:hypothetical protein